MKKALLLLVLTFVAVLQSHAYSFVKDGIYYNISGEQATVTYYNSNYNSYSVTSLIIPTTVDYNGNTYRVTAIGESAFRNCTSLRNVYIPKTVTSIGQNAFEGCSKLINVNIPQDVTSIGSSTFYGCSSLTSITLPAGVTSIGDYAFYGCSSLTSIALPAGVTSIGNYAFYGCSSLTSITLPAGVTSIGTYSFSSCSSLTSIVLPAGVTSISNYAFYGCSSLTSITLPAGVTSIGSYAFQNCSSLTSIVLPSGLTSIGSYAFDGCFKLYYVINGSNLNLTAGSSSYGYVAYSAKKVIEAKSVVVEYMDDCVFTKDAAGNYCLAAYMGNAASLALPETYKGSVYSIGDYAFQKSSSLTSITLPEGVTSIGSYAFYNCTSLTSITLPEGVTSIGGSAFYGCTSLTSITLPEGVTSIGESAFRNCLSLYFVINGSNLTLTAGSSANGYVAYYAKKVIDAKSVVVEYMDDCVFTKDAAGNYCLAAYMGNAASLVLPETYKGSVYSIGDYAFYKSSNLTSIVLPEGVTSIGDYAFYKSSNLTSIVLPEGVTSIGSSAFYYCSSLTSITLPAALTSISDYAFQYCSSLTSITLPEGVTSIGSYAFDGCSSLTSITLPAGLTSIGSYAFDGCSSLTSIVLPEGLTSISDYAFYGCSNLRRVINHSNLSITKGSFNYGCVAYYADYVGDGTDGGTDGGTEVPEDIVTDFTFSQDANGNYYLSSYTGNAIDLTLPESYNGGVYYIGESAFAYNAYMRSVVIPKNVTSIGANAFSGCALRSVTIGEKVAIIGSGAFSSPLKVIWLCNTCPEGATYANGQVNYVANDQFTSLRNVKVYPLLSSLFEVDGVKYALVSPADRTCDAIDCLYGSTIEPAVHIGPKVVYKKIELTVQQVLEYALYGQPFITSCTIECPGKVGDYAFYQCDALQAVDVTSDAIGNSAFYQCLALKTVNVTSDYIGSEAFYHCTALLTVSVTSDAIGNSAFNQCTSLQTANITAVSLGGSAISGCSSLNSLTLAEGLLTIGDYAISGAAVLPEIIIPASVTSIGQYAFQSCGNLDRFVINDNTASLSLGKYIFSGANLDYVYVGRKLVYSTSSSYGYSPFYNNKTLHTVIFNDNEDTIYGSEFSGCTGLQSVTLGNGVTSVGSNAFYGCSSLTDVSLGTSVTTLGNYAFQNCSALQTLVLPESSQTLGEYVLSGATSLKELIIPAAVTSIGKYAFQNCKSLGRFVINDNTASLSLGEYTFSGANLDYVYVGRKLVYPTWEYNGFSPFYGSKTLRTVVFNDMEDRIYDYEFAQCGNLKSVTLGDGVTTVSPYAFWNCSRLTDITLGKSVESIGEWAFSYCTKLPAITLPQSLTTMGKAAMMECESLTELTLPAAVTSVGEYAFLECAKMARFTFADSPTSLTLGQRIFAEAPLEYAYIGRKIVYPTEPGYGFSPFYSMVTLEEVHITDTEDTVYDNEFYGCRNLKVVTIGDGVTSIGNWAFSGCASLDDFSFGRSLETIGTEAFSDCTAMTAIHSEAVVPPTCGDQALEDISKWTCTVYVPEESIDDYQVADQWKDFFFIEKNDDYTTLYTITALSDDETMGSVTGAGDYDEDTEVTLTAVPRDGYVFVEWSDGTTANPFTFTAAASVTLTATFRANFMLGDVNDDGRVSVSDVTGAVNFILNTNTDGLVRRAADINGDDDITVSDAMGVVNLALGYTIDGEGNVASSNARRATSDGSEDRMGIDAFWVMPGTLVDVPVYVSGNAADEYTALQFDVTFPAGLRLLDVACGASHMAAFAEQADGKQRVVVLSVEGESLTAESMEALTLTLEVESTATAGSIGVEGIEMARADMSHVRPAAFTAAFGIQTITDIETTTTDSAAKVYDLQGRPAKRGTKGVVVSNSRKMMNVK